VLKKVSKNVSCGTSLLVSIYTGWKNTKLRSSKFLTNKSVKKVFRKIKSSNAQPNIKSVRKSLRLSKKLRKLNSKVIQMTKKLNVGNKLAHTQIKSIKKASQNLYLQSAKKIEKYLKSSKSLPNSLKKGIHKTNQLLKNKATRGHIVKKLKRLVKTFEKGIVKKVVKVVRKVKRVRRSTLAKKSKSIKKSKKTKASKSSTITNPKILSKRLTKILKANPKLKQQIQKNPQKFFTIIGVVKTKSLLKNVINKIHTKKSNKSKPKSTCKHLAKISRAIIQTYGSHTQKKQLKRISIKKN
jgi:hypothetical protein